MTARWSRGRYRTGPGSRRPRRTGWRCTSRTTRWTTSTSRARSRGQLRGRHRGIWDTGTYELEKWEPKKVMVTFHGERLRGRYALFQTRSEKDWMIHRMDPPADPDREPMPERWCRCWPSSGASHPTSSATGSRSSGRNPRNQLLRAGRFRIESRNLNDITAQYPESAPPRPPARLARHGPGR